MVSFVIMVILAMIISLVLMEVLNRNVDLLQEHSAALQAGERIDPADPYSIPSLSRQVNSLKWITLGAIGGGFLYLYATLVYMVWEGWRTITKQRVVLESTNAELEARVAERVEDLRQALEQGQRRLDAFRTAAGRLALEESPGRALQNLVDVARDLVGARYGALALLDPTGSSGKFVTSGFPEEQLSRIESEPKRLQALGLARDGHERVRLSDVPRLMNAHGFLPGDPRISAFLGVPVNVKGKLSVVFYVMEKDGDQEFTDDDERLLNLFAVQAGVHLENMKLYEEVAREQKTLAAIQASIAEGLVVLDPAGKVMYFNQTAEPLWGLIPDEVQGKHVSEVFGQKASEFESPEALLRIAQSPNGSPSTVSVTLESPQRRHLEVTSFSIPSGTDQNMTGLLARDVTQEKELQDRRDAFVSIASHELRTPMTTIMGFSELLLNNRSAPESSQRDWLNRIHQNSQVLSAIVDDMFNLSKIQTGKLAVNIERLALSGLVDEVLAGIEPDTDGRHVLEKAIPSDIPQVVADREKLTQVLINLVTNAVKYSPDGGTLTISARHEAERRRVIVAVADQGMGIAPEDLDDLFSSFHRISRPETQGIRGTGLGLSIVKGLVGLMGGEVWVKSELNKGSSFFFTVPTIRADMDVAEEWGSPPARLGGTHDEKGVAG